MPTLLQEKTLPNTYKFRSYDLIPQWIKDYLLTITGEKDIRELTLSEINGYLNGLMAYYKDVEEDF